MLKILKKWSQEYLIKKKVILTIIDEADLKSYLVDSDLDDKGDIRFRFEELADSIMRVIPEYVFADYGGTEINKENAVDKLKEAAQSIYKIKEFKLKKRTLVDGDKKAEKELENVNNNNRGEFGEILLHLLLRDFHGTIPLVSKVYFKDSAGVPAHGFDAVHISPKDKILWLGESKLYTDGKGGIRELIKDINEHFLRDYLNEQFLLIKKNLSNNEIEQRDEWINILTNTQKLKDQLKMINIPLLCVYQHDIYELYDDLSNVDAVSYHETNVRELKEYFDEKSNHGNKTNLNIILLLFPIQDKKKFVKMLHEKLWYMQSM